MLPLLAFGLTGPRETLQWGMLQGPCAEPALLHLCVLAHTPVGMEGGQSLPQASWGQSIPD